MKAYYNGITLEGTPEEVAKCMKAMKERDYSHLHDAAFNEMERIRKQQWGFDLHKEPLTPITQMSSVEQQRAYGKVFTGGNTQFIGEYTPR